MCSALPGEDARGEGLIGSGRRESGQCSSNEKWNECEVKAERMIAAVPVRSLFASRVDVRVVVYI